MMVDSNARHPIEMSSDQAFSKRIVRLAATSLVALGLIWHLAQSNPRVHPMISGLLLGGWLLMPSLLAFSLRWPQIRFFLAVPSLLISTGLSALCVTALPPDWRVALGWLLITVGVWLGGLLGIWFWYRWLPVPRELEDPFSRGRWSLIAAHIVLIIIGLLLISVTGI